MVYREGLDLTEGYRPDCALCRLVQDGELLTRLVYEDDRIIVVDCLVCRVPMAVLKTHRASFVEEEKAHIRRYFRELLASNPIPLDRCTDLSRLYGGETLLVHPASACWVIDWEQRRIPDHAHCHLRPRGFPNTCQWETV